MMRRSIIQFSQLLFSVIIIFVAASAQVDARAASIHANQHTTPTAALALPRRMVIPTSKPTHLRSVDSFHDLTSTNSPTTTLTLVGSYDTPGNAHSVVVSGTLAFVADGFGGVQILDISTPSAPLLRGNYATTGLASSVQVVGRHAFVTDETHGLLILDVSNPQQPALVGAYPIAGTTMPVQIVGSVAYVPNIPSGLLLLDIHDPAHPRLRGVYSGTGQSFDPTDVQVVGTLAYLLGGDEQSHINALEILDVTNPAKPVRLSRLPVEQNTSLGAIQIVDQLAYISAGSKQGFSSLVIIDAHDPVHPIQVGGYFDLSYREIITSFDVVGGVAAVSTINQTTLVFSVFLSMSVIRHIHSCGAIISPMCHKQVSA